MTEQANYNTLSYLDRLYYSTGGVMGLGIRGVALLALGLAVLVSGCGGGGGTGGTTLSYSVVVLPETNPGNSDALFVDSTGGIIGSTANAAAPDGYAFCQWDSSTSLPHELGIPVDTYSVHPPSGPHKMPYYIDSNGQLVNLLTGAVATPPAELFPEVLAVNSSGVCALRCYPDGAYADPKAAVWDGDGDIKILDVPADCEGGTEAGAINGLGQVAGVGFDHEYAVVKIIIWNSDGSVARTFPPPTDYNPAAALALNDAGTVVVGSPFSAWSRNCSAAATIGVRGKVTHLAMPEYEVEIVAINNRGQVLGNDFLYPIVWSPNGRALQLPSPEPMTSIDPPVFEFICRATDINDEGVIVGMAQDQRPMRVFPVKWAMSR